MIVLVQSKNPGRSISCRSASCIPVQHNIQPTIEIIINYFDDSFAVISTFRGYTRETGCSIQGETIIRRSGICVQFRCKGTIVLLSGDHQIQVAVIVVIKIDSSSPAKRGNAGRNLSKSKVSVVLIQFTQSGSITGTHKHVEVTVVVVIPPDLRTILSHRE